eukprot:1177806-Rhodomonas_salina.4
MLTRRVVLSQAKAKKQMIVEVPPPSTQFTHTETLRCETDRTAQNASCQQWARARVFILAFRTAQPRCYWC